MEVNQYAPCDAGQLLYDPIITKVSRQKNGKVSCQSANSVGVSLLYTYIYRGTACDAAAAAAAIAHKTQT